ncbi:hypothetical protein [Endozoicomonas lisbonensis]|uniref:Uracil DNA glycosylase n=1 Tax=Endozoicomonas lisbonensis TaxID=3120522 RepID=A0ABV2SED8_9GAMM
MKKIKEADVIGEITLYINSRIIYNHVHIHIDEIINSLVEEGEYEIFTLDGHHNFSPVVVKHLDSKISWLAPAPFENEYIFFKADIFKELNKLLKFMVLNNAQIEFSGYDKDYYHELYHDLKDLQPRS